MHSGLLQPAVTQSNLFTVPLPPPTVKMRTGFGRPACQAEPRLIKGRHVPRGKSSQVKASQARVEKNLFFEEWGRQNQRDSVLQMADRNPWTWRSRLDAWRAPGHHSNSEAQRKKGRLCGSAPGNLKFFVTLFFTAQKYKSAQSHPEQRHTGRLRHNFHVADSQVVRHITRSAGTNAVV